MMNFFKSIQPSSNHENHLHHVLNNVQTHFTNFVFSHTETMNFFKSIQSCSNHENPLHHVFSNVQTHFTNFVGSGNSPLWARITDQFDNNSSRKNPPVVLDDDPYKKNFSRIKKGGLKNVPVYRITYPDHKDTPLSVISDDGERNVVFYFFSRQEANAFARATNKKATRDLRIEVIRVPLTEILEVEGLEYANRSWLPEKMSTRLVPDMHEVKNAIEERKKAGIHGDSFSGVPVFQSDALRMIVDGYTNQRRPFFKGEECRRAFFFRKADLERALHQANAFNQGEIQVTSLEDIIQEMKACSKSKWDNVWVIPPGHGILALRTSWKWKVLKMAAYLFLTFS